MNETDILRLASNYLSEDDYKSFKRFINTDQLNNARLLIDRLMTSTPVEDPKHLILNELYDEIINEIESTY